MKKSFVQVRDVAEVVAVVVTIVSHSREHTALKMKKKKEEEKKESIIYI